MTQKIGDGQTGNGQGDKERDLGALLPAVPVLVMILMIRR
jgi:hypothetical protein